MHMFLINFINTRKCVFIRFVIWYHWRTNFEYNVKTLTEMNFERIVKCKYNKRSSI